MLNDVGVEVWSKFGRNFDTPSVEVWSMFGRSLVEVWSKFGVAVWCRNLVDMFYQLHNVIHSYIEQTSSKLRHWGCRSLVEVWSKFGRSLVQVSSKHPPKFGRSLV